MEITKKTSVDNFYYDMVQCLNGIFKLGPFQAKLLSEFFIARNKHKQMYIDRKIRKEIIEKLSQSRFVIATTMQRLKKKGVLEKTEKGWKIPDRIYVDVNQSSHLTVNINLVINHKNGKENHQKKQDSLQGSRAGLKSKGNLRKNHEAIY